MLDLEFMADAIAAPGETVDKAAIKQVKVEALAEAQERFRKERL